MHQIMSNVNAHQSNRGRFGFFLCLETNFKALGLFAQGVNEKNWSQCGSSCLREPPQPKLRENADSRKCMLDTAIWIKRFP